MPLACAPRFSYLGKQDFGIVVSGEGHFGLFLMNGVEVVKRGSQKKRAHTYNSAVYLSGQMPSVLLLHMHNTGSHLLCIDITMYFIIGYLLHVHFIYNHSSQRLPVACVSENKGALY